MKAVALHRSEAKHKQQGIDKQKFDNCDAEA